RARDLLRDVALVEAVVRRVDRLLAALALAQRVLLRLDELAERRGQVRLPEDLAGPRRLPLLPEVRQEHRLRVGPLLDPVLLTLDRVRGLRLDGVALRHLDRRLE